MGGPTTGSGVEIDSGSTASVGEDVFLHIEGDTKLTDPIKVKFLVTRDDPGGGGTKVVATWEDATLKTEPSTPHVTGKQAVKVKWTVQVSDPAAPPPTPPDPPMTVNYEVTDANGVFGATTNPLLIRAIKITTDKAALKLMTHEFAKAGGGSFVFDPTVPQKFIDDLTPQQRNLLLNYTVEDAAKPFNTDGRLVVFATLTKPDKHHFMGADFCDKNQAISNASFTAFWCQAPGTDVELVLHTECFVLNFRNGFTSTHFNSLNATDGKTKLSNLDKKNPSPKRFKMACGVPDGPNDSGYTGNDDLVWHRCATPDGKDVMPQNTMHGMINTVGCWMLFRNYNWPLKDASGKSLHPDFARIYINQYRAAAAGKEKAACDPELAKVGYDASTASGSTSDSFDKYSTYDTNFSYLTFMELFVGIKGWSLWGGHNDNTQSPWTFAKTFDTSKLTSGVNHGYGSDILIPEAQPVPAKFSSFGSLKRKQRVDHNEALISGNWTATRYQKPKKQFCHNDWTNDSTPNKQKILDIHAASWGDIFFFKEDGVTTLGNASVAS